ncbi:putative secreted esterase [Plesiocystis pacifica SIR-1]|uniref:Putative secreted esterase n=1 Tax=Plesiocystis pacifica SIR-1 TaxID=391625 RepID=A6FZC5_9BACT|nr:FG-GAP and VCBS repeat-containing protein [Plesiocystis pacifica]EDM81009.1 putative secreted esterase [Plesiocystis pacifica SIR-1]
MPIPRSPRALFLLPACALLAGAATGLAPAQAHAKLPGWGIDGTPGVTDDWCWGLGRTAYVGDFNGDGLDDLLCHNSDNGRRRIDYADDAYSGFWGTDWDSLANSSASNDWCEAAGEELFVGDFNGDGRDDLMCRVKRGYTNAGRKQIDFADAYGRLEGADFDTLDFPTAAQTWCTNAGEEVHVGDFNGDAKDDLLCFVNRGYANAGRKRIDFANSSGSFFGTEFNSQDYASAAQTWCTNAGESLHVGDFNGDAKDDLLCFVNRGYTNAGRRRIDFANSAGTFYGTEFNSQDHGGATQAWCTAYGDEVHVASVNGDAKDDLLCANGANGYVHVDHANSAGTFFGSNGDTHSENWCTNGGERFHTGDFDGDGKDDVLCHDDTTGYRGLRYANDAGDFHSICSDDSSMGDGLLPDLPVHFTVLPDPNDARVPGRSTHMPAGNSTHTNPLDGSAINSDPTEYFEVEVDLMNELTQYYIPDLGWSYPYTCWGSDCIGYEYDSHILHDEIGFTTCSELMNYGETPTLDYAANCYDLKPASEEECFPNACDGQFEDQDNGWMYGYACAIRSCEDERLRKPHALNVIVTDRCSWDFLTPGGINDDECGLSLSFGFNDEDFFTGWDYDRMLRYDGHGGRPRSGARGLEPHELGHVLGLGHTYECDQKSNAMHKDPEGGCASNGQVWRDDGYSTDIANVNQVHTMISDARERVIAWSCN